MENYEDHKSLETATLAGGCFWCTEAVFKRLKGVKEVIAGYSGGWKENPQYHDVTTGTSGHAESVQIKFDPKVITYKQLLDVFWAIHDPTTLNRQGNDVGPQYRTVIFYHNDKQKKTAEESRDNLAESARYEDPIVTEIVPFENFYEADGHHQDYYEKNPNLPYCRFVINPKVAKLKKEFTGKVKEN